MPQRLADGSELLNAAYKDLDFSAGKLLPATDRPKDVIANDWIERGEWLSVAKKVGAEKVFFVDNNPVVVFARASDSSGETARQRFQDIWNMARPALLFLASPGELAVYDLAQGPAPNSDDWHRSLTNRRLALATKTVEVATKLCEYRRECIETGRSFGPEFSNYNERADRALISDLRAVRDALLMAGLAPAHAHAIIGRSIFIRYLEDRKVLTKEYFSRVANRKSSWRKILKAPLGKTFADPDMANRLYLRVLKDKEFTYALFEQLAKDFNGDMFPKDDLEKKAVEEQHLRCLQNLLCGEVQPHLFFFAYKFDVIPIELISSIYEEFYNTEKQAPKDKGTRYTPPVLVEFLLSRILQPARLKQKPRVLDHACGSGIFLVEAFRRIVRFRMKAQGGGRLDMRQLRKILREQIAGIDINEEAVRVAAFSLYLAMLDYLEPPDILRHIERGDRLPNLKYDRSAGASPQRLDILLAANSFDTQSKVSKSHRRAIHRFCEPWANVIVGNPPWGAPAQDDREGREALRVAISWCQAQDLVIGGKEWSQAFIHKTLDILQDNGEAGLLVSTGVFYKAQPNNHRFREQWLGSCSLDCVVNLAHVRDVFFTGKSRSSGSLAPFAAVVFAKGKPRAQNLFEYWSAKKSAFVRGIQAIVLSRADLKVLSQDELRRDDSLWKIYWWGNHRDAALISALRANTRASGLTIDGQQLISDQDRGRGFLLGKGQFKSNWLSEYKVMPASQMKRYGPLDFDSFKPAPSRVERRGQRQVYSGCRILVSRGIASKCDPKGQIVARMEEQPFSFRHSVFGIKLQTSQEWIYKVLLGIFWSSLARYYFFLTTSKWGTWHDSLDLEELLDIPVAEACLQSPAKERIASIVSKLRELDPTAPNLFKKGAASARNDIQKLERDLDEAVFDAYKLAPAERGLVHDMCDVGLELFYNGASSKALQELLVKTPTRKMGTDADLDSLDSPELRAYLHTLLASWNRELDPVNGEFVWSIIHPRDRFPMLAVVLTTRYRGKPLPSANSSYAREWASLLKELADQNLMPLGTDRIYIEGFFRVVTETEIIIIKRNERRLWTASMAREDYEATMVQAMNLRTMNRSQLP